MSAEAKIQRNFVILLDSANLHQPRTTRIRSLQVQPLVGGASNYSASHVLQGKISLMRCLCKIMDDECYFPTLDY